MTEAEKEQEMQMLIQQLEDEEREQRRKIREQQDQEREQQLQLQAEEEKQSQKTQEIETSHLVEESSATAEQATEQPKASGWKRTHTNSDSVHGTNRPNSRNFLHTKIDTQHNQEIRGENELSPRGESKPVVNEEPQLSKFEKMKLEQQKQDEYQNFQQQILEKRQNLEVVPQRQPEPEIEAEPEPEPEPEMPKKVAFVPQPLEFINNGMDDDEIEKLNSVLGNQLFISFKFFFVYFVVLIYLAI